MALKVLAVVLETTTPHPLHPLTKIDSMLELVEITAAATATAVIMVMRMIVVLIVALIRGETTPGTNKCLTGGIVRFVPTTLAV